jgi:hypothetical protein
LKDFSEIWHSDEHEPKEPCFVIESVKTLIIYGYGKESMLKSVLAGILPYFCSVVKIEAGEQIGRLIFELGFPSKFKKLVEIDFNYLVPLELESILQNKLRLRKLSGNLHSILGIEQLGKLLQHLSSSLEELELVGNYNSFFFQTPVQMVRLSKLCLTKFELNLAHFPVIFPNITNLKVKMCRLFCNNDDYTNETVEVCNSLTSLVVEFCDFCGNDENIWVGFGRVFDTSLTRLEVPFYIFKEFGQVCSLLKGLKWFYLSFGMDEERISSYFDQNDKIDGFRSVQIYDYDTNKFLGRVMVDNVKSLVM